MSLEVSYATVCLVPLRHSSAEGMGNSMRVVRGRPWKACTASLSACELKHRSPSIQGCKQIACGGKQQWASVVIRMALFWARPSASWRSAHATCITVRRRLQHGRTTMLVVVHSCCTSTHQRETARGELHLRQRCVPIRGLPDISRTPSPCMLYSVTGLVDVPATAASRTTLQHTEVYYSRLILANGK